ncbi:MAG: nucleotidyltransferase domain-containing protein [Clostridia bacterium]|nr:nucleotidyltransferase domain-containing protein [Clostridia bacterium]
MLDAAYTINTIQSALTPVFDKYQVKKATLFGSYAKGKATEKSDIDLLLESGLRGLKFVGLIEDIHAALDKDVDVFDVTHIVPGSVIYNEINKDGVTIYEK